MTAQATQLVGLARRLALDGLISEQQAKEAVQKSASRKQPFVSYLVEEKLCDAEKIAAAAADEFGVPLLDLSAFDLDLAPNELVSEKLIKRHHALPLWQRGSTLFIGLSDPTNIAAADEIKFQTGLNTDIVVVEEDKLSRVINELIEKSEASAFDNLGDEDLDNLEVVDEDEEIEDPSVDSSNVDDAPVVRFVNKILLDAINKSASDIHFEPYEKTYRVRYRLDGILREVATPPIGMAPRLSARLKVMARLDIAERRVPQDGRIKLNISRNRSIDFRVSTCPMVYGEKIVIRVLDPSNTQMGIEQLGMEPAQQEAFKHAISQPWGLILVTGPTGSGKTVSLYTALNMLNTSDRNISTAEDPVEIQVPGINQVNVISKVGFDFAAALRSFLRQDPDIIMVGEIRDLETAEISVKAAQTGHLVLSTLHTNDAPQTISRLMNMGIPPFNIASSVSLILAQRLARKLCQNCKVEEKISKEDLLKAGFREDELDDLTTYRAEGCDECGHSGFKGRQGLYQAMTISAEMQKLILANANAGELSTQAKKEGIGDLRRAGLNKVKEGITSLEEVYRVTTE
jgi:type IV pilus assembly protein PilB